MLISLKSTILQDVCVGGGGGGGGGGGLAKGRSSESGKGRSCVLRRFSEKKFHGSRTYR